MTKRVLIIAAFALLAASAMAGTQNTNTNTVSPTLQITVNVQSAIRLTLATGTSAAAHCTVTAAGGAPDYSMNFGTVDALGINSPSCGTVSADPTSGAIYWSDYNLTPSFANESASNNTIKAQVTTNFAANSPASIVRDSANSNTVPTQFSDFTAISTGSADTIATNATNGIALTRFIGVKVAPTNGASVVTGSQNATVTFTLTVQ